MENQKNIFTTRDIYLAAALITLRFFMSGIDYQVEPNANRLVGYFSFEETAELKNAEQQYLQGQLALEPRTYISNMRALKAQVTSTYKSPHTNMDDYNK